jgi:uncharacterized LabA/DUF88 family protein
LNRVAFLIDGFNLFHSVRDAARESGGAGTKWLDIKALCTQSLSVVGGGATLAGVYYFSALAHHLTHRDADIVNRHQAFIDCLADTGVVVQIARFKPKTIRCPTCGELITRFEEKETDVAPAAKLLELFHLDQSDTVVIMTGDTDLAPGVRATLRLFPNARVLFAFPYRRKNKELAQIAPGSFKLSRKSYVSCQFANPYLTQAGRSIPKPADW